MYRCDYCGELFDEPSVTRYREDMNGEGAWQTFIVEKCPYCGCEHFEEAEDEEE